MNKIIVSSQKQKIQQNKKRNHIQFSCEPKKKRNPPLPEKSKSIPSNRRISSHHFHEEKT